MFLGYLKKKMCIPLLWIEPCLSVDYISLVDTFEFFPTLANFHPHARCPFSLAAYKTCLSSVCNVQGMHFFVPIQLGVYLAF